MKPYKIAALLVLSLVMAFGAVACKASAQDGRDRVEHQQTAAPQTNVPPIEVQELTRWVAPATGHTPLEVRLDGQSRPVKTLRGHVRMIDRPKIA
jgi:hypothetical protein